MNRFFLILVLFCFSGVSFGLDLVEVSKKWKISKELNLKINISLGDYKNNPEKEYFLNNCTYGTDGYPPKYIIKNFKVYVNNQELIIQKELLIDLYDLYLPSLKVVKIKDSYYFLLSGGDGVSSYEVTFKIDKKIISSRSIKFINSKGELEEKIYQTIKNEPRRQPRDN